jgi:cytochrome c peroxidase
MIRIRRSARQQAENQQVPASVPAARPDGWPRRLTSRAILALGIAGLAIAALATAYSVLSDPHRWNAEEMATLRTLWIGSLPPVPPDPSNAVADDPGAAELGRQLFLDPRLSANGQVSCASCHQVGLGFQDGRPLAQGVGTTSRRTPSIVSAAYSPWQFWDGRKDSQWAQALGPLESSVEHGGTRTQFVHFVAAHYRAEYESVFGPIPDLSDRSRFPATAGPVDDPAAHAAWVSMAPEDRDTVNRVFANMGKAIAAFERPIRHGPSRFDAYVKALLENDHRAIQTALSPEELRGLRLFVGSAKCIECHSGPLLTNQEFHNVGVPTGDGLPVDAGRAEGAKKVIADEFNCLGPYSDARPEDCGPLRFIKAEGHELEGSFKTPSLRDVAERAPFMHAGQFETLREVLDHYNQAPEAPIGHSELEVLNLSDQDLADL